MGCSNLPSQLSTFIGREREIATATRLLRDTRLLTLTGAGGSGKTRLALAIAEPLVRRYRDGAWFVDLAAVEDPELAPQAVANALGLRGAPDRPLLDSLVAFLKPRHLLLLLDNCEHLIETCAPLAHALLTAAPRLRIVATSREPLRVAGETTWAIPKLQLPDVDHLPGIEALSRVDAVRLFVERASHAAPGFELTEQNAPPISQICWWLGGSPLAIELAAARIRALSPRQIADRLEDSLSLLTTGDRTAPPRHRTLKAALDWSYDLLATGERALFRCLAVFAGSFSLRAAEAIYPGADNDGEAGSGTATLELLAGLIDKSLLESEGKAGTEPRYRYLAPIRQYALAKLEQSGTAPAAHDRLLTWAVKLAERHGATGVLSRSAADNVAALEANHPNLRAALEWGIGQPEAALKAHRLASAMAQFWQVRGYVREGNAWLAQLLAADREIPPAARLDALLVATFLAIQTSDAPLARRHLDHAVEIAEALGDQHWLSEVRFHQAWLAMNEGRFDEAERTAVESLALTEKAHYDWGMAIDLNTLGNLAYMRGDYRLARTRVEESLAVCRRIGYAPAAARRLVRLAQICQMEGDLATAQRSILEALRLGRETGDNWGVAMALNAQAGLARSRGQFDRAAWLLGVTHYLNERYGFSLWMVDQMEFDRCASELRTQLGDVAFEAARDRGMRQAARDPDAALAVAMGETQPTVARPASKTESSARSELPPLSRREAEVAALIAQGKGNAEIAAALLVGLRTVEAHVTHILNKLGFSSRAQIAAWEATHAAFTSSPVTSNRKPKSS